MRRSTTCPVARSTVKSTRLKARVLEYETVTAIPLMSCAIPWPSCPATIWSTSPAGNDCATRIISSSIRHDDVSNGSPNSEHRPPAWATTMTSDAPPARSCSACSSIAAASGAISIPRMFAAIVVAGVDTVSTPMTPISTPARWTIAAAWTLSHSTISPVELSIRFEARSGKSACVARARNAPCGSSSSPSGTDLGPRGPKSNS